MFATICICIDAMAKIAPLHGLITAGFQQRGGYGPLAEAVVIGDPTAPDWIIFAAYFVGAAACGSALRVARHGGRLASLYSAPERRRRGRRAAYRASFFFWGLLAVVLILLGVNKQLDLQVFFTDIGRRLAARQGWIEHRRIVQAVVAGAFGVGGLAVLAALLRATRQLLPRHVLAFVGAVLLACFLLARTLSWHDLDGLLWQRLGAVRVRHLLEVGGILLISVCAAANCRWWARRRLHRPTRSDPMPSTAATAGACSAET